MKIAVDFDGTCVEHMYPEVGASLYGAVEVLKYLADEGHELILYTMRSGEHLHHATHWFTQNGIKLHGIQSDPQQSSWTDSPKCFANIYIDDAALGCPTEINAFTKRKQVVWHSVALFLEAEGIPIPSKLKEQINMPESLGCMLCGMDARDLPDGAYLKRANAMGVPGVFRCEPPCSQTQEGEPA